MKKLAILCFAMSSSIFADATTTTSNTESSMIVGKWQCTNNAKNLMTTHYSADGTLKSTSKLITDIGVKKNVVFQLKIYGTWAVKNKTLIEQSTKIMLTSETSPYFANLMESDMNAELVGKTYKTQIETLTDSQLITRNEDKKIKLVCNR